MQTEVITFLNFEDSSKNQDLRSKINTDFEINKKNIYIKILNLLLDIDEHCCNKDLKQTDVQYILQKIINFQSETIDLFHTSFVKAVDLINANKTTQSIEHKLIELNKIKYDLDTILEEKKHKSTEIVEFLAGDLSAYQLSLINNFIYTNKDYFSEQIKIRSDFFNNLKLHLNRSNKPEFVNYAKKYYSGDNSIRTTLYKKNFENFLVNINKLIIDLYTSFSPKQKEHLKKTIQDLKQNIQSSLS